jgi:hypothetical protein
MVLSDLKVGQKFETNAYNVQGVKKVIQGEVIKLYEEDGEKFYIVESEGKVFPLNPNSIINRIIK